MHQFLKAQTVLQFHLLGKLLIMFNILIEIVVIHHLNPANIEFWCF